MTEIPEFGEKEFDGVGFPTPSSIPEETACRTLEIPANGAWEAVVMGALFALTLPENWQQLEGGISRDDAAERAFQMIDDCYALVETNQCGVSVPAPYWDDADGGDADDDEPDTDEDWYGVLVGEETFQEQIEDWTIAAFVAAAAGAGAAIQFLAVAPKFRLLFRTQSWGGIIKIFLDESEYLRVDTYSATQGIKQIDVITPASVSGFSTFDVDPVKLWVALTDEHNEAAEPKDGSFWIEVIRKRLAVSEIDGEGRRYNEECDCVETDPAGTDDWTEQPEADPRHGSAFRFPPRTSSDPQCDAAANMVAFLHTYIDGIIATASLVSTAGAIMDVLIVFAPGIGLLAALIYTVAEALLSIGTVAIDEAFTEEAYDTMLCIFYENMGTDGQIDAGQLANIDAQINAQIGGLIVPVVMDLTLNLWGEVVLSNVGTGGEEAGDCSECCTNPTNFFSGDGMGDWEFWTNDTGSCNGLPEGQYDSGNDWVVEDCADLGVHRVGIHMLFDANFSRVNVDYETSFGGGGYGLQIYDITASSELYNDHPSSPATLNLSFVSGHDILFRSFYTGADSGVPVKIKSLHFCE